jgi:hypothetical protein
MGVLTNRFSSRPQKAGGVPLIGGVRPGVEWRRFSGRTELAASVWVMTEPFLLCAACGDRIGMYEPLWCELPGGALGSSSYLNLSCEQRRGRSRFWHIGCLAPDAVPAEIESLGPGRVDAPLGDPGGGGSLPDGDQP